MVRKSMTQHDTCQWPPKQPCMYDPRPGVRCAPIKEEYRLEHDLPQKPDFAVDHKEPIVVEWPPKQPHMGQGDCCEQDTGIREDLLCKIPEQIIPQVVTVHGTPAPQPGQTLSPIQHGQLNHPLCPDGQFHMEITPPQPVKPEIRIPDLGCAVRQPVRPWKQCIENTLVNDRVRRPLARWCHKRPLPPLVIPTSELQRLKDKVAEPERKAKEREDRIRQRECQRLESRRRMSKWNYTVESLLERKREKEECKERAERESLQQLMKDIKQGKDSYSEEQLARAKKLQLYGKGLIKDFHSAMAFSKMIQDIERSREKVLNDKEEEMEKTLPICDQKCMKRMMYENDRPEYEKRGLRPKRVNEKLLKTLQSIETRQKEQKCEVENQVRAIKQMLQDNLPELPKAYLKTIQEKPCEQVSSTEKFLARRDQLYEEIDDKLAVDAYMEAHEKEVERQACEYAKYKLHKDLIRKQTEERLIREKVQHNIEKSEAAARVLVEMRKQKQKENAHDYDALKEKWEQEMKDKEEDKKEQHQKLMDKVVRDFWERKGVEKCKWQMRDVSRLWARERLVAVENYQQECERKNLRRQQAEENQLYNLALAAEKKCQQEREKMIENAWAEKIKGQYFQEMQEMKDYAQDCIRDWIGKGRSTIPMHMAMKKWEYDSQMDPRMFRNYEEKKRRESGEDERGAGDADGYALLLNSQHYVKKDNASSETTQDTARRLGFC